MKPCIPDGNDSIQIAKKILIKSRKTENKLDSLLNLRFCSSLISVNIRTINDFPILTLRQLKIGITLGSFKLQECKSYIGQLIDYGIVYFLNENQIYQKHYNINKI